MDDFFKKTHCDRCGAPLNVRTMSMYNEDVICIISPILAGLMKWGLQAAFDYTMGFELLLVNALITMIGLYIFSRKPDTKEEE